MTQTLYFNVDWLATDKTVLSRENEEILMSCSQGLVSFVAARSGVKQCSASHQADAWSNNGQYRVFSLTWPASIVLLEQKKAFA